MKISVVIPAYNEEKFIDSCLASLTSQSDMPDEIIVVDNNSTDNTIKIAKKYPVKIVSEEKQGMINARNKGFNEAKYEIIARTDADTILPSDWISKIKDNFLDEKLFGLSGPAFFYDSPEFVKKSDWIRRAGFKSSLRLVRGLIDHDYMYGPNYALRKSGWEKIKNEICLDEKQVHEDLDISIHLAKIGKIKFDFDLVVSTSFRRLHRPEPYFEYSHRIIKSIQKHKKLTIQGGGKLLMKKLLQS